MKNKGTALILAATLLGLALTACGSKDAVKETAKETTTAAAETAAKEPETKAAETAAKETETKAAETAAKEPETTAAETAAKENAETVPVTVPEATEAETAETKAAEASEGKKEVPALRGTVEGNTYSNKYLGIGCKLPEDWTAAGEAELSQLSGLVKDALTDESASVPNQETVIEYLESGKTIFDLYAQSEDLLKNLNINITYTGPMAGMIQQETLVDMSVDQLSDQFKLAGMTDGTFEKIEMEFAGEKCFGVKMQGTISGVKLFERLTVVYKDSYVYWITATSVMEDTTEEIMGRFYRL